MNGLSEIIITPMRTLGVRLTLFMEKQRLCDLHCLSIKRDHLSFEQIMVIHIGRLGRYLLGYQKITLSITYSNQNSGGLK